MAATTYGASTVAGQYNCLVKIATGPDAKIKFASWSGTSAVCDTYANALVR